MKKEDNRGQTKGGDNSTNYGGYKCKYYFDPKLEERLSGLINQGLNEISKEKQKLTAENYALMAELLENKIKSYILTISNEQFKANMKIDMLQNQFETRLNELETKTKDILHDIKTQFKTFADNENELQKYLIEENRKISSQLANQTLIMNRINERIEKLLSSQENNKEMLEKTLENQDITLAQLLVLDQKTAMILQKEDALLSVETNNNIFLKDIINQKFLEEKQLNELMESVQSIDVQVKELISKYADRPIKEYHDILRTEELITQRVNDMVDFIKDTVTHSSSIEDVIETLRSGAEELKEINKKYKENVQAAESLNHKHEELLKDFRRVIEKMKEPLGFNSIADCPNCNSSKSMRYYCSICNNDSLEQKGDNCNDVSLHPGRNYLVLSAKDGDEGIVYIDKKRNASVSSILIQESVKKIILCSNTAPDGMNIKTYFPKLEKISFQIPYGKKATYSLGTNLFSRTTEADCNDITFFGAEYVISIENGCFFNACQSNFMEFLKSKGFSSEIYSRRDIENFFTKGRDKI